MLASLGKLACRLCGQEWPYFSTTCTFYRMRRCFACEYPSEATAVARWNWLEAVTNPEHRLAFIEVLFATAEWQAERQLPPDGLVGPRSWQHRDETLVSLAQRFSRLCEESRQTGLHTYRLLQPLVWASDVLRGG